MIDIGELMMNLSSAKGISFIPGATKVWFNCIEEDISNGKFKIEDARDAIGIMIRRPAYNRLDYADVYTEACKIYQKRRTEEMQYAEYEIRRSNIEKSLAEREHQKKMLEKYEEGISQ